MSTNLIKLNVPERLNLTSIVVGFGYNRALLQQAEDFVKTLAFTEKEINDYGIESKGNVTGWKKNPEIEFEIPLDVSKKVLDYFEKLLDNGSMKLDMKSIYDKLLAIK